VAVLDTIIKSQNMVFYFTSTAVDPPAFIYVGKDKVESMSCDLSLLALAEG
jgi:hypothetical protein